MYQPSFNKGFTLIELMVSVAIMLAITATVIFNQSKFSADTVLRNNATELGLALRQAQIYGTSVREVSPGSNNFSSAYGIELNTQLVSNATSYIYYADLGGAAGIYDGDFSCAMPECLSKVNLSTGVTVSALCIVKISGPEDCTISRVNISFLRPSTEASVYYFNLVNTQVFDVGGLGVRIRLQSTTGATRSVIVYYTGQISVQ